MFQYIILMTLSTAMSYADVPSSVLQIWNVPRCSWKLKKAVLSFDSGSGSAETSECERLRMCTVCTSKAGMLPSKCGSLKEAPSLKNFRCSLSP